jgi:hypothetical protein
MNVRSASEILFWWKTWYYVASYVHAPEVNILSSTSNSKE